MRSPELMVEARKWLYEIETCEDLKRIWPAFDRWFEESEEHRAAYADARRRWQELTGLRPGSRLRARKPRLWSGYYRRWRAPDYIEWRLFLAALTALLAMTVIDVRGGWQAWLLDHFR